MTQQITSPVTAALAGSPLDLIWNKPYHQATLQLLDSKVATKLTEQMLQAQRDLIRMEMVAHLSMATQQGYHPLTVARSMQNAMYEKLGSTQARMNNIARTEVLDAYRNGARQTQMANADVLQGWVWTSVVAQTSCPSCIAMHGTVHDLSEPGPEDHPQGRCFRVPLTKPWPQLGFDVEEPASTFVDAQAWFDSLNPQQQHAMLGEKAYAAWSSGKFPMKDWAQRVENDKWRGFYRPAKPGHVGPVRKMIDDLPKVAVREEYDGMVTFYDQNGNEIAKIKKAEPQGVLTVPGPKKSLDDEWENQLPDLQPVEKKAAWVKANEAKVSKLPAGDGEWQLNKDTWVIRKDGKITYRREWHGFARTYDEFGNMTGKYKLAEPPVKAEPPAQSPGEAPKPPPFTGSMYEITEAKLKDFKPGDLLWEVPNGKIRLYKGPTSKTVIQEYKNGAYPAAYDKYSVNTWNYGGPVKEADLKFTLKKPTGPSAPPQPVVAQPVPAPKMGTPKSSYTDVWDEKFSTGKVGEKFDIDTNNKAEIVNANGQAKYVVHNKQADHYFLLDKDGYIVDGPVLKSADLDLKKTVHKFNDKFKTQFAHQKPSYGYSVQKPPAAKTTAYKTSNQPATKYDVYKIKPADYQPPKPYSDYKYSKPATRPITAKGQVPIDEQQWLHLEHDAPSYLRSYRGSGYTSMNNSFRHGYPDSSAQSLKRHIENRGYTFQNDTVSFRGVKVHADYDPGKWGVGSVQTEAGFLSTSSNFETAVNFANVRYGGNGWVLKVNVKAGQKWVPGTNYEYEMVFAPGRRFRVLKKDDATHTMEIELL